MAFLNRMMDAYENELSHQSCQLRSQEVANIPEFSSFEHQKENIFPMKQGRSASSLSRVFASDPPSRQAELQAGHAQFKAELEMTDELDDPFDVYNRYIKWTMENYPQGQTPQSNLLQLLECASKTFIKDTRYKNDPRYLKCWLQYSKLVGQSKELFMFLKVNGIGMDLAAYYEAYAELMEGLNKYKEAEEIYLMGIGRKAQPFERLTRRYRQFLTRLSSLQDSEPSHQQVSENPQRTILGLRTSSTSTHSAPMNIFHQRNPPPQNINGLMSSATQMTDQHSEADANGEKLIIFCDPDGEIGNAALVSEKVASWGDFGTELSNKKENAKEAEPWKGVTLVQEKKYRMPMMEKLEIYHDQSAEQKAPCSVVATSTKSCPITENTDASSSAMTLSSNSTEKPRSATENVTHSHNVAVKPPPSVTIIRHKEGRSEKIFVDLNVIYANGEEYSFEELRAKTRESKVETKVEPTNDRAIEPQKSLSRKSNECYEPTPKTSPTLLHPRKLSKRPSPTINTKAAFADIMELFNQPLNCEHSEDYKEDENSHMPNDQTPRRKRSDVPKTPQNHGIPPAFKEDAENVAPVRDNIRRVPFELMTPIQETSREYKSNCTTPFRLSESRTVSNIGSPNSAVGLGEIRFNAISPSRRSEKTIEEHFSALVSLYPTLSNPCNPLDSNLIEQILNSLKPALAQYSGFYDAREQTMNGHGKIEKIARCWGKSGRRRSLNAANIEDSIKLFNDSFLVRQKVGEGGFGKIYRVLDMNTDAAVCKDLRRSYALKLQMPPSAWEFYIIRKLHDRIPSPSIDSIITAQSLYYYKDESYLLTEFCNHGSILDAVNAAKKFNTFMDEMLVFFFTVELLKVTEAIHQIGIIHGDIKADNCLLRLEPTSEWDSKYDPTGAHGWAKKGIKLIDFGRAIDVTMFPSDMRFIADWKTDDQDCVEMREGRPWKWQADYYGLAGVIHCMLHNEYMQITPVRVDDEETFSPGASSMSTKKYRPIQSFKRYWQSDLWRRLFNMLLNPTMVRSDGRLPITQELKDIRLEFEEYLALNSNKAGKNLKELLHKLENSGEIY